jgi:hypothetical protein
LASFCAPIKICSRASEPYLSSLADMVYSPQ